MDFFNELLDLFFAWVFPIVYQWKFLLIFALALIGFRDAKKDFETSIDAWNGVTSGRTTNINTQDFIAGRLVTTEYTLQKIYVILGLILLVLLFFL
mgnify:CR=1 FL=1